MKTWNDNPYVWVIKFSRIKCPELARNPEIKERPILFSTPMVQVILKGCKKQTRRVVRDITYTYRQLKPIGDLFFFLSPEEELKANYHEKMCDMVTCPYGSPGDLLWVRESWKPSAWDCEGFWKITYKAGGNALNIHDGLFEDDDRELDFGFALCDLLEDKGCEYIDEQGFINTYQYIPWKPSIHMPKKAARLWLRIEEIKVERLHDISEEDALSEGIEIDHMGHTLPIYKDYLQTKLGFGYEDPILSFQSLWQSING